MSRSQIGFTLLATLAIALAPGNSLLANVLTFDGASFPDMPNGVGGAVPNGYGGLNWSNVSYENSDVGVGYANGVISPTNIAFNPNGNPAILLVANGTFTLSSGYFTAAWRDGLQITVNAYNGATLVDTQQFNVNTTGPTLETFNFTDITEAVISTSGGTLHGSYNPVGTGEQFVLDNLSVVTPEPSSLVLTALGAVGLILVARRRRARAA